jgi:hypothetical protein
MIQIVQPRIEWMLRQRMFVGAFGSMEEALLQALATAPLPDGSVLNFTPAKLNEDGPSGEEILAVFARSPHKEIDLFQEGIVCPVSDPVEF